MKHLSQMKKHPHFKVVCLVDGTLAIRPWWAVPCVTTYCRARNGGICHFLHDHQNETEQFAGTESECRNFIAEAGQVKEATQEIPEEWRKQWRRRISYTEEKARTYNLPWYAKYEEVDDDADALRAVNRAAAGMEDNKSQQQKSQAATWLDYSEPKELSVEEQDGDVDESQEKVDGADAAHDAHKVGERDPHVDGADAAHEAPKVGEHDAHDGDAGKELQEWEWELEELES